MKQILIRPKEKKKIFNMKTQDDGNRKVINSLFLGDFQLVKVLSNSI